MVKQLVCGSANTNSECLYLCALSVLYGRTEDRPTLSIRHLIHYWILNQE